MASNNVASEVICTVAKLNDHLATAITGDSDKAKNGTTTTIVTLEGENNGATMEAEGDVEENLVVVEAAGDEEEERVVSAYTNSNYHAVNNSVFVAGSCAVKDPGVHTIIVEHVDEIRSCDDDDDFFEEGEVSN